MNNNIKEMKSTLKYVLLINFISMSFTFVKSQPPMEEFITGSVKGKNEKGQIVPLPYANIYWVGSQKGTVADGDGNFIIQKERNGDSRLVASYVGYVSDTLNSDKNDSLVVFLLNEESTFLHQVEIKARQENYFISQLSTIKTENITSSGLQQLACCNLSESFENSATVDVGYADAVSGAKQIQMLGLAGIYTQLMFENMPFLRGMGSPYGLNFVPGPWMQSIQVSKGTSSVINGFESITGQINIEYLKPEHWDDRLYVNLFGNSEGRAEVNVLTKAKMAEALSTLIMLHGSMLTNEMDNNNDGFMDLPRNRQLNFFNRWTYDYGELGHSQLGINVIDEYRFGGSMGAHDDPLWRQHGLYASEVNTRRYQGFLKSGFRLDEYGHNSIGFQASGVIHTQDAYFGDRFYNAQQQSLYGNLILQLEPGHSEQHKISTGVSFQYDRINEDFWQDTLERSENIPGVFIQYTYERGENLTMIAGARLDYHNIYGSLFTPRIHLRWQIRPSLILRASAGKGYRSSIPLAENLGYLSSSREIILESNPDLEEAWNYGLNITKTWPLKDERNIEFTLDFYRTDFIHQIVADAEFSARKLIFHNLEGESYSNSLQTELHIEPIERLKVLAAFRFNDVKITMNDVLIEKPFVSKYKGLINLSYNTRFEKWQFDFTGLYNSSVRIPFTGDNPIEYQLPESSPNFLIFHAQVTRRFKKWEIYAGSENLGDYRQKNPILQADDPFGPYFDASLIWGPLNGRMIYAGLRWKII